MPLKLSLDNYDVAVESAAAAISSGGLVIYPTDTLYGIGCDATSKKAVARIYALKRREGKKPLSILVANYEMLLGYCEVSPEQERVLHALLPGPYTFILKLKKKLPVSDTLSIGVRVPDHQFMRGVSKKLQIPIVTTSANLSGEPDAAEASQVAPEIAAGADLLIDGGRCRYAQGSTIIDLVNMEVLRKGATREGDRFEFEK
jgi:tRNA threonylcarbamoyl adenosine modification protein (Sua5/YciO/YrdC/YwlC family)